MPTGAADVEYLPTSCRAARRDRPLNRSRSRPEAGLRLERQAESSVLISFFPDGGEVGDERFIAHPRFVLRIAGDPVEAVAGLHDGSTAAALAKAESALAEARRRAPATCALLEGAHPRIEARDAANALLKVKRDFYNLRPPPARALDLLLPFLAPAERAAVEAMLAALDSVAASEAAAEQAYRDEMLLTFQELERRFARHNLRDALQRTNPFLAGKLDRLHAGKAMSAKDAMSLNMALFSYLHRAALKTSPRSSLTLVAAGAWIDDRSAAAGEAFALAGWRIERSITARHGLVERLFLSLLRDLDSLAPDARLRLNPTARVDQDALTWRQVLHAETVEQETYGIGEALSKVAVNRGLELLLGVLDEAGPDGLSLAALTDGLRRRLPEQGWPAIPRLVQRALTHAILGAAPGVGEQVDKLVWAKRALPQIDPSRAAPLGAALDRFGAAIEACEAAAGTRILPAYRELEDAFGFLAESAGAPISIEAARPVVHEDCLLDSPALALRPADLGRTREDLPWLLRLIPLLRGHGWPQSWLTARFLEQFGPAGRCDDPEAFLLAAANELTPPGKDRDETGAPPLGDPPDHPLALAADRVARSFSEALEAANGAADEWRIPRDLIRDHHSALPEALRRRSRSHCMNAQFYRDPDGERLMVNAIYPGNARIMHRFLGTDPEGQADIRAFVRDLAGGDYAAIPGVFGFNANIHAPLADRELGLPPRGPDFEDAAILPLDRLHIAYDAMLDRIVLADEAGTKVEAYYFGILNSQTLPSVHRMLDWMSGSVNSLVSIGQGLPSRRVDSATGLVVQPRISLGSLVLARSARIAPIALLPDPQADDYRFFAALRTFCAGHGIWRQSFFRFQGSEVVDSGRESNRRRAPKWRKPMYLDLDNPLSVRAMQRALRRHEGAIEFAEALPAPEAAPVTVNGAAHVSELSFEIGLRGY